MWPNQREAANLVTFTEEIFNGKLYFCAVKIFFWCSYNSFFFNEKSFKNCIFLVRYLELDKKVKSLYFMNSIPLPWLRDFYYLGRHFYATFMNYSTYYI